MIPKDGKDLKEASGWRPITIGNLLERLYSSLVESRIKSSIMLILRQKGFTEGNGCYANIKPMDELIRIGKRADRRWQC